MGHSSNRTLVRVLRLGGARRRFVLAAAKHSCGACGAQKRPAGPNVSRSPNSVVNDVVGLDLFILDTYERHTLPAMNIVCWGTGLQRVVPLRDQSGETFEDRVQKQLVAIIRKAPHPCHRSATQLVLWHFCRTLKANGKTERAGKDWKEDCYKLTQDSPEAQTWTDFEEDCDAVNHKPERHESTTADTVPVSVFEAEPHPLPTDGRCPFGMREADPGVVSRQQAGELTPERSMTMRRLALQASLALDHKRRWKRALHHAAKHYQGEPHVGLLATWSKCRQETNKCFLAPERCHQQHHGHSLD